MTRFSSILLAGFTLCVTAGCSPSIDVKSALAITDVTTGWYDAGIVQSPEGEKNKLVPSISFQLKNQLSRDVSSVQINSVFRLVGDDQELGSAWVRGIGPEGLKPGGSTAPIVLRSPIGFTGLEPRAEMLQNSKFVDARVEVFAKHGSASWTKLGEWSIQRQLLTR